MPPVQLKIEPVAARYAKEREEQVQDAIDELWDDVPEMAAKIEDLSWVKDGIGRGEFDAFRGLISLADAGHLKELIEETWVVEGGNYPALESLWILGGSNPEALDKIMSHPTISDGISEQEAKVVASLHPFLELDLLDKLLDPEQVTLEERTITLSLSGETHLSIVRTRQGADHTMDLLERAVRTIEEFMGLPFPRRQAVYLFEEDASGAGAARNLGTRVVILIDEQVLSGDSMLALLTHETSHYYWTGGTRWIHEGAATFMESVVKDTLQGPLDQPPCAPARNIVELEDLESDPSTPRGFSICHYSLGERLFRDLYRNMDETTFRLAFRRLYLHTVFNIPNDGCDDYRKTICHVRESFSTYANEETAATLNRVIDRWHDGAEPFDISSIGDTPVVADIAAINGRIEEASLSYSTDGLPLTTITLEPGRSSLLYLNLDYTYGNTGGLESIPIDIAISYEDGFVFERRRTALPLLSSRTRWTHPAGINHAMALGRYWVHAYWGEQKIAEATLEIIPVPDTRSIRGVITVPAGRPFEGIALEAQRGEEGFWVEVGPDGAFDVVVSSGSFVLEVLVLAGSEYISLGWYDGNGGITSDPTQAFKIIVDDEYVESIEIMLPPVWYTHFRGVVTCPDREPVEGIGLDIQGEEDRFWAKTGLDGAFDVVVSSGSYILEVLFLIGNRYYFLGWYDGAGGITTDPTKASEVIVEDADIDRIEIRLPASAESLICPSGLYRSSETGQCAS